MSYTLALLQYDYNDKNQIVLYSNPSTATQDALNYLLSVNVKYVSAIPDYVVGYFAIKTEFDIYKIYNCYLDQESNIQLQDLVYNLQYISISVKL